MRSRLLAGWRGLLSAFAVAGLVLSPAVVLGETSRTVIPAGNTGFGSLDGTGGEDSIDRPRLYPRANYVWSFAAGPTYGLSSVDRSERRKPGMLHTQVGVFDLSRGLPEFPAALEAQDRLGELGTQYFLVQLHPDALDDDGAGRLLRAIESSGGAVVGSKPVATFVARLNAGGLAAARTHPGVIAVASYHPAFKLNPMIGRVPLPDPYRAISDVYTLDVLLFPGEEAGPVADAIADLGGSIQKIEPGYIQVDLHRDKLAQLAALEPVARVVESLPMFPKAEETTTTIQTGAYNGGAVPYHDAGIDGSGGGLVSPATYGVGPDGEQLLMILDNGIQLDAGDLSDTRVAPGTCGDTHRKCQHYTTDVFGMNGDLLGCDATTSGGVTHGHTVAATALGLATGVDEGTYGDPWQALDEDGNPWRLDGVAPGARLIAYDAMVTPTVLNCDDPGAGGLIVGTTYNRTAGTGSLFDGYTRDARISNFSWGGLSGSVYSLESQRVDQFLFDHRDAMLFVAAGNEGDDADIDGVPDEGSVPDPATCKNAVVVGASYNANDTGAGNDANSRAFFSSVGPAVPGDTLLRIAPILMAPGDDQHSLTNMGIDSEFHCRTQDNDQDAPVECDLARGQSSTSFASPAAAGAGLLVRDYFHQGFYPDGTTSNPGNSGDQVEFLSGALVKAVLIASAEFMDGDGLTEGFRFNNEQGYGRIQLDRILPLSASSGTSTPTGLVVADHGNLSPSLPGPNDTSLLTRAQNGVVETHTFNVPSNQEELRVACVWVEDVPVGGDGMLDNNIDIELEAPDGTTYFGNLFTEDNNRNDLLDAGEDCDGDGKITEGAWSLVGNGITGGSSGTGGVVGASMTCTTASTFGHDGSNPTEAIFLSPDPAGDGIDDDPATGEDESADNMIQTGLWELRVIGEQIVAGSPEFQPYACAIGGPLAPGSTVRFDSGSYVCNGEASVSVNETDPGPGSGDNDTDLDTAGSPAARADEVATRVVVQVVDRDDVIVDEEGCALDETKPCLDLSEINYLRYEMNNPMLLSDGMVRSEGGTWHSGVIDVRSGESLRVIYRDETAGAPDPDKERFNTAGVDCAVSLGFGGSTWMQFGRDTAVLVDGGCERDARGKFTFGHPDKYMDEDEKLGYRIVFQSEEPDTDLEDVRVSLTCVLADPDSPAGCMPGTPPTGACPDPDRGNNPPCEQGGQPFMTILDSPRTVGLLPAGNFASSNFTIEMASEIPLTAGGDLQTIEMVLGVSASSAGKPVEGRVVSRHVLNADERSFNYSTDFPTGGIENRDYVNDEILENPTTVEGGSVMGNDYRFETIEWDNLTLTGRNGLLDSPWDFEGSDGGFMVGLHTATESWTTSNITNWGEDLNFNGILDPGEDRDPTGLPGGVPDRNWSTEGGCGWQSTSNPFDPFLTGGVWHTGTIGETTVESCFGPGTSRQCQSFETHGGGSAQQQWIELLKTPVMEKVNQCPPDICIDNPNISCPNGVSDCIAGGATGPCVPIADPLCGTRRDEPGNPVFTVEFIEWAWNQSLDLPDELATMTWELDTDLASVSPSNLDAFPALNLMSGPHGPYSGGNDSITDGFQLFAPRHVCAFDASVNCSDDPDCDPPNFDPSIGPCVDLQQDVNGQSGLNRVGGNSCFFDGWTDLPSGLAKPRDDDQNNDGAPGVCVADSTFVNGQWVGGTSCLTDNDCALVPLDPTHCSATDSFVTQAGPIRNMDISKVNGPDMRLFTLEDIYGLSGSQFQGAIGFVVHEGTIGNQPTPGFGVAIDDMVVSWREFDLQEDDTECDPSSGGGSCASVEIEQTRIFEGSTTLEVTILDEYPYDSTSPTDLNDCNLDGTFEGTDDCNGNGIPDIVALATAETTDQEVIALDEVAAGVYKGTVTTSVTTDVDGVLFLVGSGTDDPTIRIRYLDRDDGTGNVCPNSTDPGAVGVVEASSTVFLTLGSITVLGARITNDPGMGDDDVFADTNETLKMFITVSNKTGMDLDNVIARIVPDDPKIDCVLKPVARIGSLARDELKESGDPVVFKIAGDAERTAVEEDFAATFTVTMSATQFDSLLIAQRIVLPLDLDVSGGGAPATFSEGFESADIPGSQFVEMPMDELPGPDLEDLLVQSDGYRCQYNDCDGPNPNGGSSAGSCPDHFLGFLNTSDNAFDWHLHTTAAVDGGRAFGGSQSLHFGKHGADPSLDTTRLKQLDAIRTSAPINLGYEGTLPELSFKHQVSLMDYRGSNSPLGESVDRAVVHIRFADADGVGVGHWIKVYPYQNVYDIQGTDAFINAKFDPIDDGNTEDDYFDPTDPNRRLGPSSTCYPEFVFGYQGDIDYRNTFTSGSIGRASDGPGLQGSIDRGTWVETRFLLSEYLGRRVFLRFLTTSIEVGDRIDHMDANISDPNDDHDDGWYIDDVVVTGALTTPAILSVDINDNSGLPVCGPDCTTLSPALAADPPLLAVPGHVTELSARASFADNCTDGALQYQFWIDGDSNDILGDAGDILLRDWTDNPVFRTAVGLTTDFGVIVRCSSAPETCSDAASVEVTVLCPSGEGFKAATDPAMAEHVFFEADKATLSWRSMQFVDIIRGNLDDLLTNEEFADTVEDCIANNQNVNSWATTVIPPDGGGVYYLVRGRSIGLKCNEIGGYKTATDDGDRDAELNGATNTCP